MTGDREEHNRVLGVPLRTFSRAPQGEEPQRVLGIPVDWLEPGGRSLRAALAHAVRECRRWVRRLGLRPSGHDGRGPSR